MSNNKQIHRPSDLARHLGVSKTTLWRWRKAGRIPQPLTLGPRMIGWRTTDIEHWLDNIQQKGGM